jgi:alanine dehydrogenase
LHLISAAALAEMLAVHPLVERLRQRFRDGVQAPRRLHYPIANPDAADGTLLVMPAWTAGGHIGIKLVTVFPDNAQRALPSVLGSYVLMDATTGVVKAMIDAPALTVRRTAAASALAADYLARTDASRLLVVGTGQLAPYLAAAHAAVRPIRDILIWGRDAQKAELVAAHLRARGLPATCATDLADAAAQADIISCATLAQQPILRGEWLRPGTHVDLVGGFTPTMREADDVCVQRARLFVDSREGALAEAGDIVDPLQRGVIQEADICADLFDLTREQHAGRSAADDITLFKSVGHALEDLAAAELVMEFFARRLSDD